MKNIYIIGCKGIPANYGGFETFVEKLISNQSNIDKIKYFVSCLKDNSNKSGIDSDFFQFCNATCFNINMLNIGAAKAIFYDVIALDKAIKLAIKNKDIDPIFYILTCRIGPFIKYFKNRIAKLNGKLLVNPDGHEWLREKWNKVVKKYWKYSESLMIKHADMVICDSKNIEQYIKNEYSRFVPKTKFIAYGTDVELSKLSADIEIVRDWYNDKLIRENNYYLAVGRFVPENNYMSMIKEFMRSDSTKDFVIITNITNNNFFKTLKRETNFDADKRIKFVGTVYNQELLKYIRENAFAYIHGHEVGGTNPSLLEALAFTPLNLLLDVGFNKEVAENNAIYWKKDNLSQILNIVESMPEDEILSFKKGAKARILNQYSWKYIVSEYENLFLQL